MTATSAPTRVVHCEDALPWLRGRSPLPNCSLVTSLPDVSGLPHLSLDEWKDWFVTAAKLVLSATPPFGVTIFFQTDIKRDGCWIDKGYLCQKAAEEAGSALLWHKLVCRKAPGTPAFGRPGYAHLLCFSRDIRDDLAFSTTDILPSGGKMTWSRAMGVDACLAACRYVEKHTETRTIVDPFCGHGSVLAAANHLGLDAIGVEIGKKRARKARALRLEPETPRCPHATGVPVSEP